MNKLLSKTPIALLLSLTLCGCAIVSHSDTVKKDLDISAQQFVGKSTDDLLMMKGAPNSKAILSTGDMLWSYRTQKTGDRKGHYVTMGDPGNIQVTWYEITNYVIGSDNIIKRFTSSVE